MEYKTTKQMTAFEALKSLYPDSSRRTLQNWIKAGRFKVDGTRLERENTPLHEGQILSSQEKFCPPRIPGLPILYEDRSLIAIDKPLGLLSVPLDGGSGKHALGMLRDHFGTDQIFAVHRIDRETSGALLFARGKEAAERLNLLFERHDLKREYFAIVEGRLSEEKGTWKCPLLELSNFHVIESPEGKMAITHYEVVRKSAKYSYLKLTLETGKKHQIRVHTALAGHPIVGDKRYGARENPMGRLGLHARLLELVHPFTGQPLSIRSPLPRVFEVLGGQISKTPDR